jgi:hypothetical protein
MTREQFEILKKLHFSKSIEVSWNSSSRISLEEEYFVRYAYGNGEIFLVNYHYKDIDLSDLEFKFIGTLSFEEASQLYNKGYD